MFNLNNKYQKGEIMKTNKLLIGLLLAGSIFTAYAQSSKKVKDIDQQIKKFEGQIRGYDRSIRSHKEEISRIKKAYLFISTRKAKLKKLIGSKKEKESLEYAKHDLEEWGKACAEKSGGYAPRKEITGPAGAITGAIGIKYESGLWQNPWLAVSAKQMCYENYYYPRYDKLAGLQDKKSKLEEQIRDAEWKRHLKIKPHQDKIDGLKASKESGQTKLDNLKGKKAEIIKREEEAAAKKEKIRGVKEEITGVEGDMKEVKGEEVGLNKQIEDLEKETKIPGTKRERLNFFKKLKEKETTLPKLKKQITGLKKELTKSRNKGKELKSKLAKLKNKLKKLIK